MDITVELTIESKGRKLNWRQACSKLGCKKSHFYNLINSGRIPSQRHGEVRGVWVYEVDCESYLLERQGIFDNCVLNV